MFHNNFQGRTNVSWPILDKLLIGIIDNICNSLNSHSSLMKNKTSKTYKIVFHKFSKLWEEITWWKHPGFRIFRFFLTLAPSITTWLKALYQHQKKHFLLLLPVRECWEIQLTLLSPHILCKDSPEKSVLNCWLKCSDSAQIVCGSLEKSTVLSHKYFLPKILDIFKQNWIGKLKRNNHQVRSVYSST